MYHGKKLDSVFFVCQHLILDMEMGFRMMWAERVKDSLLYLRQNVDLGDLVTSFEWKN